MRYGEVVGVDNLGHPGVQIRFTDGMPGQETCYATHAEVEVVGRALPSAHTLKGNACSCGDWTAGLGKLISREFDQHLLEVRARLCTPERHAFGEDGKDSVSLVEGESKPCLCDSVSVALREGRLHLTVQAAAINERIDVGISPVRSVLGPRDTLGCSLTGCTFPGQHGHGADR
jgi:hypothetical protein